MTYLQDRCAILEQQIEQHINNEEAYESQINDLMKSVSELQNQLQTTNGEKVFFYVYKEIASNIFMILTFVKL